MDIEVIRMGFNGKRIPTQHTPERLKRHPKDNYFRIFVKAFFRFDKEKYLICHLVGCRLINNQLKTLTIIISPHKNSFKRKQVDT